MLDVMLQLLRHGDPQVWTLHRKCMLLGFLPHAEGSWAEASAWTDPLTLHLWWPPACVTARLAPDWLQGQHALAALLSTPGSA